ncbi:hypothetical protein OG196_00785 [Kitasatospora purpeofusca]|uniref:hypothetical protein n=1 Tax=Kitasatospora purpeofusca TaxID=67352 RepID=UPI002E0EE47F|nr:hypothetical protein OG196_00785 [Kitasatospora purpeofusca]
MKMTESVAGALKRLPEDQLDRFLRALADLAEAEPDPRRREFLESFPGACGLVDDED